MKKQLVASLAAAMVLGVAGTSFAATNPFTDVPANNWAYGAVAKLAKAGIVDGYSDGTFKGDKLISRYEMAQMVAKAMAHSDKATAEQKATIDKLSVEFASELEGLNVRVTKLEKNSSTIKVSGNARIQYLKHDAVNAGGDNSTKLRTRVNLDGSINEDWSYYGRLQAVNNLTAGDEVDGVTMDNAFVKGPIAGTTMTAGRFDYFENNGLMIDSTLNGVNFAFGNVLKANVFYGNERNTEIFGTQNNSQVLGTALTYGASKVTNINGGYYQFKDRNTTDQTKIKVWELGFNTKLAADWALQASYGKSDVDAANKAYFAQLNYKAVDTATVGTYTAWVGFRHIEASASPETTFDNAYAFNTKTDGAKGYELGFAYVPMKNSKLTVKYADLKATTANISDSKSKQYLAQMEFFF